jgi:hypothetical protein
MVADLRSVHKMTMAMSCFDSQSTMQMIESDKFKQKVSSLVTAKFGSGSVPQTVLAASALL